MEKERIVQIAGLDAVTISTCNLGHGSIPRHLWDKDGFGYYQCTVCGLVWVSPQLTDAAVAQIYETTFGGKIQTHQKPMNFNAYQPVLRRLHPYRTSQNHLLDVGCFTGNFLLAAREAGWQVEGTEISEPAIDYARSSHQLKIHAGDLTELNLPDDYYDTVTLFDVIEHVKDPQATIAEIYRILRPGGILYMDTPHFRSVPRWILGKDWNVFFPWHRTYFSVANMKLLLEMCQFKVKHIEAIGVLPMHRFNAWQAYQDAHHIQPTSSVVGSTLPFKHLLRPLWLGFKYIQQLPFKFASKLGLHIGAKLVVYAEKASA